MGRCREAAPDAKHDVANASMSTGGSCRTRPTTIAYAKAMAANANERALTRFQSGGRLRTLGPDSQTICSPRYSSRRTRVLDRIRVGCRAKDFRHYDSNTVVLLATFTPLYRLRKRRSTGSAPRWLPAA